MLDEEEEATVEEAAVEGEATVGGDSGGRGNDCGGGVNRGGTTVNNFISFLFYSCIEFVYFAKTTGRRCAGCRVQITVPRAN